MRAMKDSGIEWIGEIPQEWNVVPIGGHFTEVKTKNSDFRIKHALQFKMGNIVQKQNNWYDQEIEETYTNYLIVFPETIMINGLNLEFDFITQRVAIVREKGIITSTYLAMTPNITVYSMYACYLFKAFDTCKAFHSLGRGLRKTLTYSELKKHLMLLPSKISQQNIANFLDQKCAQIDNIIEKQKQAIEKLKSYKQSVITEAVTKGLDKNAPMRDSGIEWLGMMPEDWNATRLKFVLDKIVDCPHETPNYINDGAYLVIRTADQGLGKLCDEEQMYRLDEGEYRRRVRRETLNIGDIVYGREGERWGLHALYRKAAAIAWGNGCYSLDVTKPKYYLRLLCGYLIQKTYTCKVTLIPLVVHRHTLIYPQFETMLWHCHQLLNRKQSQIILIKNVLT